MAAATTNTTMAGVLVGLLVAACGGEEPAEPDAQPPAPDAGHSTVRGKAGVTYHPDGKPEDITTDLSRAGITATYFDGDGMSHVYLGKGTASGTFTIEDVPEAPVDISYGGYIHVVTAQRDLDFGVDQPGRSGWLFPSPGTELVFNIDGMSSWTADDELGLYTGNLGFHHPFITIDAPADPPTGVTALSDYVVSWDSWPLIEGTKGDRSQLVHYTIHRKPVSGEQLLIATQVFEPDSFDQIDGGATVLTGSFVDLPTTETIDLRWAYSTFSAMRQRIHPDASPALWANVEMYAQPGGIEAEVFSFGPRLMEGYSFALISNIDFGVVEFGNPFPDDWPVFLVAYATHYVELTEAEGRINVFAFGDLLYAADLATYGTGPIELQVTPVGDLRIDGYPAYGFPGGFGTTPLVTWSPPAVATGFEILVVHTYEQGGESDYDFLARFTTVEPEFRFPPGMLADGEYYYIIVSAIYMPDIDLGQSPLRRAMVRGRADAISDLFTP